MKPRLTIAVLFLLAFSIAPAILAQQTTCACDKAPKSTCEASVKCPDGCTALCGSGDTCYLACRNDLLPARVTVKFIEKPGQEIAAVLSERTHTKIEFEPNPHHRKTRYTLELNGDNIWNACNILNKHGNVKVRGVDFEEFKILRRQMRSGKISVKFMSLPVKDVIAWLSFASGYSVPLISGDPERILSISLRRVTFNQALARISAKAGVKLRKQRQPILTVQA